MSNFNTFKKLALENIPVNVLGIELGDVRNDVKPWSFRNSVLRVGDGKSGDDTTWYYRGAVLSWACGRFSKRYKGGLHEYATVAEWKKSVDEAYITARCSARSLGLYVAK